MTMLNVSAEGLTIQKLETKRHKKIRKTKKQFSQQKLNVLQEVNAEITR